jgi:hypothetical protein
MRFKTGPLQIHPACINRKWPKPRKIVQVNKVRSVSFPQPFKNIIKQLSLKNTFSRFLMAKNENAIFAMCLYIKWRGQCYCHKFSAILINIQQTTWRFSWKEVLPNTLKNIFKNLFVSIRYTQWQCIYSFDNSTALYRFLKTFHPGGVRTRDHMFWRRTRWPLRHAARELQTLFGAAVFWFKISNFIHFSIIIRKICTLTPYLLFQKCFYTYF